MSAPIKRYMVIDPRFDLVEDSDGDWVRFDDHLARINALFDDKNTCWDKGEHLEKCKAESWLSREEHHKEMSELSAYLGKKSGQLVNQERARTKNHLSPEEVKQKVVDTIRASTPFCNQRQLTFLQGVLDSVFGVRL